MGYLQCHMKGGTQGKKAISAAKYVAGCECEMSSRSELSNIKCHLSGNQKTFSCFFLDRFSLLTTQPHCLGDVATKKSPPYYLSQFTLSQYRSTCLPRLQLMLCSSLSPHHHPSSVLFVPPTVRSRLPSPAKLHKGQ